MAHKLAFGLRRATGLLFCLLALAYLTACDNLTGLSTTGGGKSYPTVQRQISASIRSVLMDIGGTPLDVKRAVLIFDLVTDEANDSVNAWRRLPGCLFNTCTRATSATTTKNAFSFCGLADNSRSKKTTGTSINTVTHFLAFGAGYCLGMVISLALCFRLSNRYRKPFQP